MSIESFYLHVHIYNELFIDNSLAIGLLEEKEG